MPQTSFTSVVYHVPDLDCSEELALIEKGLRDRPGIESISPDYLNRDLRISLDLAQVSAGDITNHLEGIGFSARLKDDLTDSSSPSTSAIHRHLTTAVGGVLLLAAATAYAGGAQWSIVNVLLVVSTLCSALPVVRAAWRAVRLKWLDMNALMTIAATGALAIGETAEAATAMFLFGVSVWLESYSLDRARRAVRTLVELTPMVAHRVQNAATVDVDPGELQAGDEVLVKPGERFPVDAVVEQGVSAVNQAPITGESIPVEKSPGDEVFAGTLNGEAAVHVRATKPAVDSTLAHIARLVEQAQTDRSPTQRFVDRFARRYTPAVIVLAILLTIVPPLAGQFGLLHPSVGVEWTTWLQRGLVLLVIACPCALVISTPVTIVCGLRQGTREGMLIKGGEHLENAASIDALAIDKTGTLTNGQPRVTKVVPFGEHREAEVLQIAAALESQSEHPLATAIVEAATEQGLTLPTISNFEALRGYGVRATVEGQTYYVGNQRLMAEYCVAAVTSAGIEIDGDNTLALVATSQKLVGVIYLADTLREDAIESLQGLQKLHVRPIVMLTGDRRSVAEALAADLPIDEVHADLLPDQKLELVEKMAAQYRTLAMVGDGVNDAPALVKSELGIALGSQASDTALETADVVIMTPRLSRLVELVRLGRSCRRLLRQNIALALGIKLIVLVAAGLGWATMWMAVAADVGASMIVIANGMRILQRPDSESTA